MKFKQAFLEKGLVVLMFVLVLVVFSFAERDTKKIVRLYTSGNTAAITNHSLLTASQELPVTCDDNE